MRFSPSSVAAALSCISTTSRAFAARCQGSAFGANSSLSFFAVSHAAHPFPQFRLRFPPDDAEDGDDSKLGVGGRASRAVEKRGTSGLSPDGSCLVLGGALTALPALFLRTDTAKSMRRAIPMPISLMTCSAHF
jgi:hypothetical protein